MTNTSGSATRLHINWTLCDGRGLCTELLPDILARDDWGYPLARDRTAEPHIPQHRTVDASAAVRLCPRLALSLHHT